MPRDPHPAAALIDEARFMRRMAQIVDVSAEKVETLAASVLPAPPGPVRLEVPTVNADGWTPAVLYVVRTERAKATPLDGIAALLGWMFNVEVSPQVLLAAVLHFDLDRRDAAAAPAELQAVQEQSEPVVERTLAEFDEVLALLRGEDRGPERAYSPHQDHPIQAPVHVTAGSSIVIDEAAAIVGSVWPNPDDPCNKEPWAGKALALHVEGQNPFAIARALKMYGATDFKVRCLVVPGFREQTRDKVNAARGCASGKAGEPKPSDAEQEREDARLRELRGAGTEFRPIAAIMKREGFKPRTVGGWIGRANRLGITPPKNRPAPSLPPVSAPKPQPREPETKPQRPPKPSRRAVAKAPPAALPWSPPARTAAGCNSEVPAPGEGLHILALEPHHCRWLMGPGADGLETYCGCQKSARGSAYCDAHAKEAFDEWPPRAPLPKRPTRMARSVSALPDASNQRRA